MAVYVNLNQKNQMELYITFDYTVEHVEKIKTNASSIRSIIKNTVLFYF